MSGATDNSRIQIPQQNNPEFQQPGLYSIAGSVVSERTVNIEPVNSGATYYGANTPGQPATFSTQFRISSREEYLRLDDSYLCFTVTFRNVDQFQLDGGWHALLRGISVEEEAAIKIEEIQNYGRLQNMLSCSVGGRDSAMEVTEIERGTFIRGRGTKPGSTHVDMHTLMSGKKYRVRIPLNLISFSKSGSSLFPLPLLKRFLNIRISWQSPCLALCLKTPPFTIRDSLTVVTTSKSDGVGYDVTSIDGNSAFVTENAINARIFRKMGSFHTYKTFQAKTPSLAGVWLVKAHINGETVVSRCTINGTDSSNDIVYSVTWRGAATYDATTNSLGANAGAARGLTQIILTNLAAFNANIDSGNAAATVAFTTIDFTVEYLHPALDDNNVSFPVDPRTTYYEVIDPVLECTFARPAAEPHANMLAMYRGPGLNYSYIQMHEQIIPLITGVGVRNVSFNLAFRSTTTLLFYVCPAEAADGSAFSSNTWITNSLSTFRKWGINRFSVKIGSQVFPLNSGDLDFDIQQISGYATIQHLRYLWNGFGYQHGNAPRIASSSNAAGLSSNGTWYPARKDGDPQWIAEAAATNVAGSKVAPINSSLQPKAAFDTSDFVLAVKLSRVGMGQLRGLDTTGTATATIFMDIKEESSNQDPNSAMNLHILSVYETITQIRADYDSVNT